MTLLKQDYYRVLGISHDATADEVRKAYHQLARKYHPDVSTEPDAENRFKAVNEAYRVLSDASLRQTYDRLNQSMRQNGRSAFRDYAEVDNFYDTRITGRKMGNGVDRPYEQACSFACPHCGEENWVFFGDNIIRWRNHVISCDICTEQVHIDYRVKRGKVVGFEAKQHK